MFPLFLFLLWGVLGCFVLYVIVRKGVAHGILDADAARTAQERRKRFEALVEDGTLPDPRDS